MWDADTLEVKHARRGGVAEWDEDTQTAVTRANAFALTSLAAIPNATLVACASRDTSVVRFLDIGSPAEAPQVPLVHSHVSVDGRGPGDARRGGGAGDAAATSFGVDALAVSGGEVTYGAAAGDRAFAPRGPGSGAPKLWAVARGSGALGDARLVSVDLGTLRVGPDALTLPGGFFPRAFFSERGRRRPGAASVPVLARHVRRPGRRSARRRRRHVGRARRLGSARRAGGALPRRRRGGASGFRVDRRRRDRRRRRRGRVGRLGVPRRRRRRASLRRASRDRPAEGKKRWHDGDALHCSPVAVYGSPGTKTRRDIFAAWAPLRAAATARWWWRPPAFRPYLQARRPATRARRRGARCTPRRATATAGTKPAGTRFVTAPPGRMGSGSPRAGKKKAAKKARKKYPKRQGGSSARARRG